MELWVTAWRLALKAAASLDSSKPRQQTYLKKEHVERARSLQRAAGADAGATTSPRSMSKPRQSNSPAAMAAVRRQAAVDATRAPASRKRGRGELTPPSPSAKKPRQQEGHHHKDAGGKSNAEEGAVIDLS